MDPSTLCRSHTLFRNNSFPFFFLPPFHKQQCVGQQWQKILAILIFFLSIKGRIYRVRVKRKRKPSCTTKSAKRIPVLYLSKISLLNFFLTQNLKLIYTLKHINQFLQNMGLSELGCSQIICPNLREFEQVIVRDH